MDYYHCEICDMAIKPKSKSRHFKSIIHKKLAKHKHIKLTIDNPNLDDIDKIIYNYINEYDKKYGYYYIRCEFKLVFSNMEGYAVASSILKDNNTMFSWKILVEKAINNFIKDGYIFSHISKINCTLICNERNMTYKHYLQQPKSMLEWEINAIVNRNKKLINIFPPLWIHPLNRRFQNYRI